MKHKKLLITAICLATITAVLLLISYYTGIIQPLEDGFYSFISTFISPALTAFMQFVSFLIDPIPLIIICLSLFIFKFTRKYYAIPIAIGTGGATLINIGIKEIVKRPRPDVLHLVTETSYSLPSSHAAASMAFFTLLIFISRRVLTKRWVKNLITTLSILMILIVGISRIYLGVHHLGDVLIGWCVGFIVAGIGYLIYDRWLVKNNK